MVVHGINQSGEQSVTFAGMYAVQCVLFGSGWTVDGGSSRDVRRPGRWSDTCRWQYNQTERKTDPNSVRHVGMFHLAISLGLKTMVVRCMGERFSK